MEQRDIGTCKNILETFAAKSEVIHPAARSGEADEFSFCVCPGQPVSKTGSHTDALVTNWSDLVRPRDSQPVAKCERQMNIRHMTIQTETRGTAGVIFTRVISRILRTKTGQEIVVSWWGNSLRVGPGLQERFDDQR